MTNFHTDPETQELFRHTGGVVNAYNHIHLKGEYSLYIAGNIRPSTLGKDSLLIHISSGTGGMGMGALLTISFVQGGFTSSTSIKMDSFWNVLSQKPPHYSEMSKGSSHYPSSDFQNLSIILPFFESFALPSLQKIYLKFSNTGFFYVPWIHEWFNKRDSYCNPKAKYLLYHSVLEMAISIVYSLMYFTSQILTISKSYVYLLSQDKQFVMFLYTIISLSTSSVDQNFWNENCS